MNGVTASIIMSGDTATDDTILALEKEMELMRGAYGEAVEIILYFSKPPKLATKERNLVFTTSRTSSPFQNAIVVSSGEILLFTTLRNFLADEKNKALNQALDTPPETIAAPLVKNLLGKLGLSRVTKTSYIIAKREIILNIAHQTTSLASLLYLAIRKDTLVELPNVGVAYPEHVMLSQFSSPAKKDGGEKGSAAKDQRPIKYSDRIPVFIICRDRLEPLKKLVKWCEDEGLKNLIFIDSQSTYPPLIEYYAEISYEVIRLNHNVGYLAPWLTGAVDVYAKNKAYIVSDADIIPEPKSHGAVRLFCRLLNKYPRYAKAGFGLRIDDIPKNYEPRDYVIAWEKKFWQKEVEKDVFEADIDTTFALWRQNLPHVYGPSLRTGGDYIARHDTWYIDSKNLSEEICYYREHADKVISTWGTDSGELQELYVKQKNNSSKKKKKADPKV